MDMKETIRTVTRDAQTFRITPFTEDQLDYLEEYVLGGQVSEVLRLTEEIDDLENQVSDTERESNRLERVMNDCHRRLEAIDWDDIETAQAIVEAVDDMVRDHE